MLLKNSYVFSDLSKDIQKLIMERFINISVLFKNILKKITYIDKNAEDKSKRYNYFS